MKQSPVLLSIIIVSYNTRELLEKCLDSVIKSLSRHPDPAKGGAGGQDLPTEIIVVDNHSQDNTVTWLKKYIKASAKIRSKIGVDLSLIVNNDNLGFAKANNQGIKIARGEYILLLNSDTIVKNGALGKMVSFMEERKEFAILGPKLLNADGTPQPSLGKFPTLPVVAAMLFLEHFLPASFLRVRGSPKNEREGDWVMGAALLLRREVYEKIGGLDENIFMYMEEADLTRRIRQLGFKTAYFHKMQIIHLEGQTTDDGTIALKRRLESTRYYCEKYKLNFIDRINSELRYSYFKLFIYKVLRMNNKALILRNNIAILKGFGEKNA